MMPLNDLIDKYEDDYQYLRHFLGIADMTVDGVHLRFANGAEYPSHVLPP